jgi:hypothetical protein
MLGTGPTIPTYAVVRPYGADITGKPVSRLLKVGLHLWVGLRFRAVYSAGSCADFK